MDGLQHIYPDVNLMDGYDCFCHMDGHDVDLVDVIKYDKTRFGDAVDEYFDGALIILTIY